MKKSVRWLGSCLLASVFLGSAGATLAVEQTVNLDGSGNFISLNTQYGENNGINTFLVTSSSALSAITGGAEFLGTNSLRVSQGASFRFEEFPSQLPFDLVSLFLAPISTTATLTLRGFDSTNTQVALESVSLLTTASFTQAVVTSFQSPTDWQNISYFTIDPANVDYQINRVVLNDMPTPASAGDLQLLSALPLMLLCGLVAVTLKRSQIRTKKWSY